MDLPILGTVDLTPSGIFLFLAGVIAIGYFGWQIFGTERPGRDAAKSADAPQVESGDAPSDDAASNDADADAPKDDPTDK